MDRQQPLVRHQISPETPVSQPHILEPWRPALLITTGIHLTVLAAVLAWRLVQTVQTHSDGPTLNRALAGTGMLQLVFCVLLSVGILIS